jgi:hypothetical protein
MGIDREHQDYRRKTILELLAEPLRQSDPFPPETLVRMSPVR